jgi:hypothetical protein
MAVCQRDIVFARSRRKKGIDTALTWRASAIGQAPLRTELIVGAVALLDGVLRSIAAKGIGELQNPRSSLGQLDEN